MELVSVVSWYMESLRLWWLELGLGLFSLSTENPPAEEPQKSYSGNDTNSNTSNGAA